jgi:hypothetical protein
MNEIIIRIYETGGRYQAAADWGSSNWCFEPVQAVAEIMGKAAIVAQTYYNDKNNEHITDTSTDD